MTSDNCEKSIINSCAADHDIWLLASGGEDGVASLGDSVEAGSSAATVVRSSTLYSNHAINCIIKEC